MANIEPQAVAYDAPPADVAAVEVEEVVEKIFGEEPVEEVIAEEPAEEPAQEPPAEQQAEIVDEILEQAVKRAVEERIEEPVEQNIETHSSSPSTIPEETSEQIVDQPALTLTEEGPVTIEDAPIIVTTELERAIEQRATSLSEQPTIIITQEPDTVRIVSSARASSSSTSTTGSVIHNEAESVAPMIKTEKTVRFDKPRMRDRIRHKTIRACTLKTLLGREVYAAKGDEIHKLLAERAGKGIEPRTVETRAAA